MNRAFVPVLAIAAVSLCLLSGCKQKKSAPTTDQQPAALMSYALGVTVGADIKRLGADDIDIEEFTAGLRDTLQGKPLRIPAEGLRGATDALFRRAADKRNAQMRQRSEASKKAGEQFLADNAKKPGIKVTASGLQYQVIKEGTGPKPTASDRVSVHYEGTLVDGTVFDSSRKRGQPATFPINNVIAGWTEGLQLMKVGSVYKLYIPANLAYGERVQPDGPIPPNAALVFDVELLGIVE